MAAAARRPVRLTDVQDEIVTFLQQREGGSMEYVGSGWPLVVVKNLMAKGLLTSNVLPSRQLPFTVTLTEAGRAWRRPSPPPAAPPGPELCVIKLNTVVPCATMAVAIGRDIFHLQLMVNTGHGMERYQPYVSKGSQKRSAVLRFCPFCGVNVETPFVPGMGDGEGPRGMERQTP